VSPPSRAPSGLPAAARRDWLALAAPAGPPPTGPGGRARLPEPARRWLAHALDPGASPAASVELAMHGEIFLGRWRRFRARQVIAPGLGFVWAAVVGRFPMRITGHDRYANGDGDMRWRMLGTITVMSASGADVTRSAAGRLAGESVLCPSALAAPGVAWRAVDDRRATAVVVVDGLATDVTVTVDDDGRLLEVTFPRWGDPDGDGFRQRVFRVACDAERRFGAHTIASRLRAGWGDDDGWAGEEFFRAEIDEAVFR